MDELGLTLEIGLMLGLLALTIFLFVTEIVRVDLAALVVLVILGILSTVPGVQIIDAQDLFRGFASNAVIVIMSVTIMGAGLDRTGVMSNLAAGILKIGGTTEARVISTVSGTVGVVSSFMVNIGAAALFVPVISRISIRTNIPLSRLAMPMGFCALLGGTMTMVGNSPFILLNDLIITVNRTLIPEQQVGTFDLFDVTPVGIVLLALGILYFVLLGRFVLPARTSQEDDAVRSQSIADYFARLYGFKCDLYEVLVPEGSPLVGAQRRIDEQYGLYFIAIRQDGQTTREPPRSFAIAAGARLAVMASQEALERFAAANGVEVMPGLGVFAEEMAPTRAGIAEIIIPPNSHVIGRTPNDLWFKQSFGLSVLAIHRAGKNMIRTERSSSDVRTSDVGAVELQGGDALIVHTTWEALGRLERDRDFVVVTQDYPKEELRPQKVVFAVAFFALAIGLVLFTDIRVPLCLLIGAVGMVASRVLTMDEAYEAIVWRSVFLLGSLIPLGQALQATGTAEWIAGLVLGVAGDVSVLALQFILAALATLCSLVMSNVGATLLLVPIAINLALSLDADPALFAITVALAASNSFLIPTHYVNAFIMGAAGYRVADYLRAGSLLTVLFLIVSVLMLNVVFKMGG